MRLWSIHPKYLDCRGIVALWREGLLAKKVLEGKTMGYRNHPELERFRSQKDPVSAINAYLFHVWEDSRERCYSFDRAKIGRGMMRGRIGIGKQQVDFEFSHLKGKLRERDNERYRKLLGIREPELHPLFVLKRAGQQI